MAPRRPSPRNNRKLFLGSVHGFARACKNLEQRMGSTPPKEFEAAHAAQVTQLKKDFVILLALAHQMGMPAREMAEKLDTTGEVLLGWMNAGQVNPEIFVPVAHKWAQRFVQWGELQKAQPPQRRKDFS